MKVEVKDLLQAGAHFGHKSERWNPKMSPFIYAKKSGIHVIDLEKTKEELEKALDYVSSLAKEGKTVLFVGTKRQAQEITKEEAEKAGMPYVNIRWLGGTLTNFKTVVSQVKKMVALREEKAKGEWEKYSKKEQALRKKELERLTEAIGGLENLKELPDALFIIDILKENIAIKEAKKMKIPTIAIVDTNTNPDIIDYVIPANDDAVKSIRFIAGKIADAISDEKELPVSKKEDKKDKEEKIDQKEEKEGK